MKKNNTFNPVYRLRFVYIMCVLGLAILLWRVFDLQVIHPSFLQQQGDSRALREVKVMAYRGIIYDRLKNPLAVSTPVESLWVNPLEIDVNNPYFLQILKNLKLNKKTIQDKIQRLHTKKSQFLYLKRHLDPYQVQRIKQLALKGVYFNKEYRRYYPMGEVFSHLLGFTDIDDKGQAGIEKMLNSVLQGVPGKKRVIRNSKGNFIELVDELLVAQSGMDIILTLDARIQALAYRELKKTMQKHQAESGSVVVLNTRTFDILAMVNQPGFNPNSRKNLHSDRYRNRAVTDVFEPGSTMKPITISAALMTGRYHANTMIDTRPGFFQIGRKRITDHRNYGLINVATVIQKSSNVGTVKIALSLRAKQLWQQFKRFGFSQSSGLGFSGESGGVLRDYHSWKKIEQATMAFGYGLSVTPIQLARAYAVFANKGKMRHLSFLTAQSRAAICSKKLLKSVCYSTKAQQLIPEKVAKEMLTMMESVVKKGGTAHKANIPLYRVAGKTGTVKKLVNGRYSNQYIAVFAGIAPVTDPHLVIAVMINKPNKKEYYGGLVAAPLFAKVMEGSLRLLNIRPDGETYQQLKSH